MTFDELQKSWQAQQSDFKLKIDSTILLKEVQRSKEYFEYLILWRDIRETVIAFLVAVYFLYMGLKLNNWTLYLSTASMAFIAVFLLIDRVIQKGNQPVINDSLLACIECSLTQVEHQIWLLKNVFWWGLLPVAVTSSIFFVSVAWRIQNIEIWQITITLACFILLFIFIFAAYYVNQYAVRKELLPRKQELEQLLHSLKNAG